MSYANRAQLLPAVSAYYRLGESTGTVATDETGNNNGTYHNSPTLGSAGLVTGDADTAVTFNGTNQGVNTSTASIANVGDISVSCLCNLSGDGALLNIGSDTYNTDAQPALFSLDVSSGVARVWVRTTNGTTGSSVSGATTVTGGVHNVVATRDSTTGDVKIYVDGRLDGSGTLGSGNIACGDGEYHIAYIQLGSGGSVSQAPGVIDEAIFYDGVYNTDQINYLHMLHQGLESYDSLVKYIGATSLYRLSEESGTTAYDSIGSTDLTLSEPPTLGTNSLLESDAVNKAMTFNGSTDYIDGGDVHDIGAGDFTICAVVEPNTVPTSTLITIAMKSYPGVEDNRWWLILTNNHFSFAITYGGNVYTATDAITIDPDTVYQVAGVVDRTNNLIRLYINGTQEASTDITSLGATNLNGTRAFRIGAYVHTDNTTQDFVWDGVIDDVVIAHQAYTADQLTALHAVQTDDTISMTYNKIGMTLQPDAYFRLGETTGSVGASEVGSYALTHNGSPTLGVDSIMADATDKAINYIANGGYSSVSLPDTIKAISFNFTLNSAPGTTIGIAGFGTNNSNRVGIFTAPETGQYRIRLFTVNPSLAYLDPSEYLTIGQAYNIAYIWDGVDTKLYIDGVEKASVATNMLDIGGTGTFTLGTYFNNNFTDRANGDITIDEVMLWLGTAPTPDDIRLLDASNASVTGSQGSGEGIKFAKVTTALPAQLGISTLYFVKRNNGSEDVVDTYLSDNTGTNALRLDFTGLSSLV